MGLMLRINIPKRGQKVTNGDLIKVLFPKDVWLHFKAREFNKDWWNAPYTYKEENDGETE